MPGWNDPLETFAGQTGQVYAAPVGTALPVSTAAAVNAAFNGLGYLTEDGVSINQAPGVNEHGAWQTKYPVRRIRDTEEFNVNFAMEQWNETNVPLAFGGGEVVDLGSGQYRYDPPTPDDDLDEKALIVDVDDGDRRTRIIVPRGSAVEAVEAQFNRSQLANLPITFKALEPGDAGKAWYFFSNDEAAFAAGS